VAGGSKSDLELELPMKQVVQTLVLPSADDIDPDVLSNMTSLGCFKDKDRLTQQLLNSVHNTEKVIYFLLLDRKRRRPAFEDETEVIMRNRCTSSSSTTSESSTSLDPPRKRIDTRNLFGNGSPVKSLTKGSSYENMPIAEGSPIVTRRYPYG